MPSDLVDPEIRPLWEAVAARLALGNDPASIHTVTVKLSPTGEAMVHGWLRAGAGARGRRSEPRRTGGGTAVPVQRLLSVLGRTPTELHTLVQQAGIAISDRQGPRLRAHELRSMIAEYTSRVLPDTPLLRKRLLSVGVTDATVRERLLLTQALAIVRALAPLPRPVTIARLAHDTSGDPHLFDLTEGRHGDKLVLLTRDMLDAPEPQTPAQERVLLAHLGIIADRLSQTVLMLNVNATGDGPADRALRQAFADGRPVHLTLHDLTRHPPRFDASAPWSVVENPSVVDEAMMRGMRTPVVCTSGTLTAVDHVLLALAHDQGVSLCYSGDIDAAGHSIARAVHTRYGARVQHMDPATLQHAATYVRQTPAQNCPLDVRPPRSGTLPDDSGGLPLYQEHPAVLNLLLGSCHDDPLTGLWCSPASARTPAPRSGQAERDHGPSPTAALGRPSKTGDGCAE
ncbi:hypothetical protein GCM10010302_75390 [Streptomyces polychromogenes]|uniref:DUF2399 domain-containing protein n=1 Tax=Streptomyces polychromogenes TaxID=67342 RepID=A0ABP3FVI5_9ACTN